MPGGRCRIAQSISNRTLSSFVNLMYCRYIPAGLATIHQPARPIIPIHPSTIISVIAILRGLSPLSTAKPAAAAEVLLDRRSNKVLVSTTTATPTFVSCCVCWPILCVCVVYWSVGWLVGWWSGVVWFGVICELADDRSRCVP